MSVSDRYYIRSKSNPEIFWAENEGTIFATKHSRTKFKITIQGRSDGEVIVPDDKILITAYAGDDLVPFNVQIMMDSSLALNYEASHGGRGGGVKRGGAFPGPVRTVEYTFSDFKKSFHPVGKEGEPADAKILYVNEIGDEWELVA